MVIGVLEDNPLVLDFLLTALRMDGHKPFGYTSGLSFLDDFFPVPERSDVPRFDAILLDLNLPDLKGHDIIGTILTREGSVSLPIAVITGAGSVEVDRVRSSYPHIHILEKPIRLNQLRGVLSPTARHGSSE